MQLNKEYLIAAGCFMLFIMYYLFGWFFDKNFRLVMNVSELSPAQKRFFRFRGSKSSSDDKHAVICIRAEMLSFINIIMGILCFAAIKFTGKYLVYIGSVAFTEISLVGFVFIAYMNINKYRAIQNGINQADETSFENYEKNVEAEFKAPEKPAYPTVKKASVTGKTANNIESGKKYLKNRGLFDNDVFSTFISEPEDEQTDNIESGKNQLKSRNLLDDDVFLPCIADAVDKFDDEDINTDFREAGNTADGRTDDIKKGKKYLENRGLLDDDVFSPYISDPSDEQTDNIDNGKNYLKNRNLLDGDIFSPYIADAADKFVDDEIDTEYRNEIGIEEGKKALKGLLEKQLYTESYRDVSSFTGYKNTFGSSQIKKSTESESSQAIGDIINKHKKDLNPENQFKTVNKNNPVRKDDKQ